MKQNVGSLDKIVRVVIGLTLIAFAFQNGLTIEGWHWLGLIGFVPLLTAIFGTCPAYSLVGVSTCEKPR